MHAGALRSIVPRKGIVTTNPLYWMPVNVQEWLSQLAGAVTTEQFGAIAKLVLTSWTQHPPCTMPADPEALAQASGLGSRWSRNATRVLTIAQFREVADGRLLCGWLNDLYKEQRERYEHRSKAGKENRAKREQHDLPFPSNGQPIGNRRKNQRRTNGSSGGDRREKGEGVVPKGTNTLDPPNKEKPPDAPAPSGARVGLSTMPPITDILRLAGVER
jgi:hypothetical protein